jgi:putative phage repressor|nr:MAG TPA: peptidase [Caudoviricetes sp.]
MSTINERIKSLVDYFSKGNNSDFANKIGINEANVRNYIANTEPKFNVLEKIANNFEINFEWLLTGKGEMLKKEEEESEKKSTIIKIDKTKTIDYMPKVIVVDRHNEEGRNIPLVSVKAQAGYLIGYEDTKYIEKLPMYSLPGIYGGTFRMFQIEGNSMYPTLQDGSYVIAEFVHNFHMIRDNRVYVIVTERDGIIVKRVKNRIAKYHKLYCSSDNRDYGNISIPENEIKEIWECKMYLSFEFLDPITNYQKIADLEVDVHNLKEQIKHLEEGKGINTTTKLIK